MEGPEKCLGHKRQKRSRKAKVFRAHAAPRGMCDDLIYAPKLLANQRKDGDSPVRMIAPGLLEERWRKTMDGLRLFIAVHNNAAVKIEDLQKETRCKKVVKPRFTADCLGAVILERPDELTLRAHEEGVCVPSSLPCEGPEWEAMCYQYLDLHQAVKSKTSGENKWAKLLWSMKEAKGMSYCDSGHEKEIKDESPCQVGLVIYSPKKPTGRIGKMPGRSGTG